MRLAATHSKRNCIGTEPDWSTHFLQLSPTSTIPEKRVLCVNKAEAIYPELAVGPRTKITANYKSANRSNITRPSGGSNANVKIIKVDPRKRVNTGTWAKGVENCHVKQMENCCLIF